jgi:hypothetical protein
MDTTPTIPLDDYFAADQTWKKRVEALTDEHRTAFRRANAEIVPRILAAEHPGLRAIINMGARALTSFVEDNAYKNAYERPRVEDDRVAEPSERRLAVDRLLFGDEARNRYFAAASLGGIGCRFYGEYCVVLKQGHAGSAGIFDRNSYDLAAPPLDDASDRAAIVQTLRGNWSSDVVDMITAKVLPEVPDTNRLTTPGQISDLVLRDEDFAEVHIGQPITRESVEEVRKSPEEASLTTEILDRYRAGDAPSPTELTWAQNRHEAEQSLRKFKFNTRVVATSGRGFRWR